MNYFVICNLGEYQGDLELLKVGEFFERFQPQFIRDRNDDQDSMMKIKKEKNWYWGMHVACQERNLIFLSAIIQRHTFHFFPVWNICLEGACRGGHPELVKLMIQKGANNFEEVFYVTCYVGRRQIVDVLKNYVTINDWNTGLYGACEGGHLELAEYVIYLGAHDHGEHIFNYNQGLSRACGEGHQDLIELMIQRGATYCRECDQSMDDHLRLDG